MDLPEYDRYLLPELHEHTFERTFYPNPTWCTHCGTFIWGVTPAQQRAWKCVGCAGKFHGFCHDELCALEQRPEEISSPRAEGSVEESMAKSFLPFLESNGFNPEAEDQFEDDSFESNEQVPDCQHQFKTIFLKQPTWCSYCGTFIWGISPSQQQAVECTGCHTYVHSECQQKILECPSLQMRDSSHIIVSTIFPYPTWCSHCNSFIWNPSGWKCKSCGLAVHESCKETMLSKPCEGGKRKLYSPQTVGKMKHIPTRYMSQLWGSTTSTQYPKPAQTQINLMYAWVTGCNLEEAEKPPSEYPSLNHFFKRNLKEGVRTIDQEAQLVSPVDGRLIHFGKVDCENGVIEQVKGVDFSLSDFMGKESTVHAALKRIKEGDGSTCMFYSVIYLAPGDYHGFRSPCEWTVEDCRHFPGHLFPVNSWATSFIKGLFAMNERVVLTGKWQSGFFSYAPVGAYNVGSIELAWDENLATNRPGEKSTSAEKYVKYEEPKKLSRSDHVGFFNLGSSIILVFEAPSSLTFCVPRSTKLKLGTPVATWK